MEIHLIPEISDLSEIAFRLELALRKAQVMTKSNDAIYEADFEIGKVRQLGHFGDLYNDEPLEDRLAEVKVPSKVPIRNHDDICHALTDRKTLDKVLEQGLDEEHQKYKEKIVEFCMSLKDCILKEGEDNTCGSYGNDHQGQQRQHAKCYLSRIRKHSLYQLQ